MTIKDLYIDKKRVIVTAHRGFSGKYPENSILAFEKAFDIGADLIEFDIRLTKDGVAVVLHDSSLSRLYNEDVEVNSLTYQELKSMRTNERGPIVLFTEVLDFFKEVKKEKPYVGMNIQIKESLESLIQIACSLFKQYNLYGCAYFTVSTFEDAEKIRHYDNKIDICILERKKPIMKNF